MTRDEIIELRETEHFFFVVFFERENIIYNVKIT